MAALTSELALLVGSVTELDSQGRWCSMEDGDRRWMVSRTYCAFCNAINGHQADGEAECIHKQALALAWQAEVKARDQDAADLKATYRALFP